MSHVFWASVISSMDQSWSVGHPVKRPVMGYSNIQVFIQGKQIQVAAIVCMFPENLTKLCYLLYSFISIWLL